MRKTRSSKVLEISKRRLERLKAINPPLQTSEGISVTDYETSINQLESMEAAYNTSVSDLDSQLSAIKVKEKSVRDQRERMLQLVAAKYGKDSDEYVAAGGIRKSERKKPQNKTVSSEPNGNN